MTEPRELLRRSLWIGACFSAAIALSVALYDHVIDVREVRLQTERFPVPLPLIVIASLLLGMGIGTQWVLFSVNRHRLEAILRPRPVRVLVALLMTLVAPIYHFWGIPFAYGFAFWAGREQVFDADSYAAWDTLLMIILLIPYPAVIYLATCLTLAGIRRWLVKVAVLGQVWLALYGAVILLFGFYVGNL